MISPIVSTHNKGVKLWVKKSWNQEIPPGTLFVWNANGYCHVSLTLLEHFSEPDNLFVYESDMLHYYLS